MKRRSFLWRWRRGFFLVGLLLVAAIAGTGFVLAQIDRRRASRRSPPSSAPRR
jgi:hypothetical protein